MIAQDEHRVEVRRRDGRNWSAEVKGPGETITIHGLAIAVDSIYA